MNPDPAILHSLESHSSLLEKTDPQLRRRIDQAILDRDPPTYQGVWEALKLAEKGIGYYAFYRYARKLRARAVALESLDLVSSEDAHQLEAITKILAQRLLEAALDESTTPAALHRLTTAWRASLLARTFAESRETDVKNAEKNARKKESARETDELVDLLRQYNRVRKAELQNETQEVRAAVNASRQAPP